MKWKLSGHSILISKDDSPVISNIDTLITISGRVINEDNIGLPGANIIEAGTINGCQTDANGRFSFRVPKTAVLLVTYLGYRNETEKVAGKINHPISMIRLQSVLNETVVTGYGNDDRHLLTGNISQIKEKTIEDQHVPNPLLAIEGRLPGIFVAPTTGIPGSGFNVRIRGQNSLRNKFGETGNNPLYVVDGIPYIADPLNIAGISPDPIAPIATMVAEAR